MVFGEASEGMLPILVTIEIIRDLPHTIFQQIDCNTFRAARVGVVILPGLSNFDFSRGTFCVQGVGEGSTNCCVVEHEGAICHHAPHTASSKCNIDIATLLILECNTLACYFRG